MGSIFSTPKAPTFKPFVPPTPLTTEEVEPVKTDTQLAAETRTDNLLRRARGKIGTVLTGFEGVLASDNQEDVTKKTLLGE